MEPAGGSVSSFAANYQFTGDRSNESGDHTTDSTSQQALHHSPTVPTNQTASSPVHAAQVSSYPTTNTHTDTFRHSISSPNVDSPAGHSTLVHRSPTFSVVEYNPTNNNEPDSSYQAFGTQPVFAEPANQPVYAVKPETYIAEAIARDKNTGLEHRATVHFDAPPGANVYMSGARKMSGGSSSVDLVLPRDYNTGAELEAVVSRLGRTKSSAPLDKIFFLGLLAGTWVTFAGLFAQQVVGGVPAAFRAEYPVVPKLLIGLTFPIGIVFIVLFGGELFTGNTMVMAISWLNKKVTIKQVLLNWTIVFFSNFAACVLWAYLLGYLTDIFQDEPYRSYVVSVATRKANLPFAKALLLAIPANALVCLSIFLGLAARDVTGKILGLYLPILTFAATGWEHVVANMYFISVGWMYGADVTVGTMARNLAAVAIGNIIGGGVLIGGSEYYMYHWHSTSEPTRHLGKWGSKKADISVVDAKNLDVVRRPSVVMLKVADNQDENPSAIPDMEDARRNPTNAQNVGDLNV
ncbi:Formate/nitrite transporter-domain-containing protein [Phlyctochytrium arcticum]|nr:Formate/nitrite transporter-domain-containing protein [Phlyctochytrium arcticum]